MREADVAIRLRQPTQPDLIQRKLFSVHFHAYASPDYLKRFGTPRTLEELDDHRIVTLGGTTVPAYLQNRNWLTEVGRNGKGPRKPRLIINNIMGVLRACQRGARHRDCCRTTWSRKTAAWCSCSAKRKRPALDAYFVYPEELKSVARVQAFRDFLVSKAQRWSF